MEVRNKVWADIKEKTTIFERNGWTDPDDLFENYDLFTAYNEAQDRLDCNYHGSGDPFRLARNEVPVGLALLKVDKMLLHMHDPWNLIIKKRKLVNAALIKLDRLNKV